jgi:hypothetical protein
MEKVRNKISNKNYHFLSGVKQETTRKEKFK